MKNKFKNFVKSHKYEIVLVSVGAFIGSSLTRRKYEGREDELVEEINRSIRSVFDDRNGDFRNENGSYIYPVWNKM